MRMMIPVLVLAAMAAVPAFAQEAAGVAKAVDPSAKAGRTVYICDGSAMTRRAFTREFGVMEFVKAETILTKSGTWSAPKCVTPTEARRLKQLASLR